MRKPLLSVITPSYNHAQFLEANLCSVMSQQYPNIEHIVVDGNSTDGTIDILKQYKDRYNLKWVSEPDRGQCHAVNKGIKMANGEWVIWLNSDDYFLPSAFEVFAETLADTPTADVIYANFLQLESENRRLTRKFSTPPSKHLHKHLYSFTGNHSMFLRRDFLSDIGGIDEEYEYVMDAELLWRVLTSDGTIVHTPSFIAVRRLHDDAKSIKHSDDHAMEMSRLKQEVYGKTYIERLFPNVILQIVAALYLLLYYIRHNRQAAARSLAARMVEYPLQQASK